MKGGKKASKISTNRMFSADVPPYLIEELLPCGVGLNGKLQLSVHGGNSHTDLEDKRKIVVTMGVPCNSTTTYEGSY